MNNYACEQFIITYPSKAITLIKKALRATATKQANHAIKELENYEFNWKKYHEIVASRTRVSKPKRK